ncbi:MAG: G8 domain-containing protein [Phycisphaerae bacterium]|nr:G8 domain-containing protein [Phycisphaerae bacterium]
MVLLAGLAATAPAADPHHHHPPAAVEWSIVSVADGRWSNPATWKPARLPAAGDRVLVSAGTSVVFDVGEGPVIHTVHVAGRLNFARDRSTRLDAGLVSIGAAGDQRGVEDVHGRGARPLSGAALEVGTVADPIPAAHTARIRLHFLKGMDPNHAPAVICRPGGRLDLHGAALDRPWMELAADLKPGDIRIHLAGKAVGWKRGDEVLVTASLRARDDEASETETRRIEAVRGDALVLDRPLAFAHLGSGRYRSEVANLSRTVIVESADPDGIRGHTMYHRHAAGSISYARFAHLGKKNVLGRYPIHFHRLRDTMRGSSVVGAVIIDSHNRWVTVHGTQYMVVRDCIGFGSVGHGFFLEDGTEIYNIFDRNLAIQARLGNRLPGQVLPFDPNDGAAFWWANGRNTFTRNVACENDRYGFRYDSQKRSNFDSTLPIRQPDGREAPVDIRTLPIYRFSDNESHTEGLYSFAFAGAEGTGPDRRHPHLLRGLTAWQTHYALRSQLPTMWIEDVDIDHAAYGIYRPWFQHHVYRNIRIADTGAEPFNRGLDDRSTQHGPISVDGLTFVGGPYGSSMPLIQISADNVGGTAESHFRNVKVQRGRSRAPLVNLGGGPRRNPTTARGVPVYLHDWYGPGRHAKVISTRARDLKTDGNDYRADPPLTGDESVAAEVTGIQFPRVLDPVDDQPPATVITHPRRGQTVRLVDGMLVVRGTTTDDHQVARVVVNGVQAELVEDEAGRWRAIISGVSVGSLKLSAGATDKAGNVEQTPHLLSVQVAE